MPFLETFSFNGGEFDKHDLCPHGTYILGGKQIINQTCKYICTVKYLLLRAIEENKAGKWYREWGGWDEVEVQLARRVRGRP